MLVEFASVVATVICVIEIQRGMIIAIFIAPSRGAESRNGLSRIKRPYHFTASLRGSWPLAISMAPAPTSTAFEVFLLPPERAAEWQFV
jgi:hypothetical protein